MPGIYNHIIVQRHNPISQEVAIFLQQLRVGVQFEEALNDLDHRVGSEDLTLMTQSIAISRQTGGNLTEVFDRISGTIRERRRIEGKIKSMTAQGKIQGRIVSAIPLILAGFLYVYDPAMMTSFFRSVAGIIVLFTITIMMLLGGFLIRKIVNIDV